MGATRQRVSPHHLRWSEPALLGIIDHPRDLDRARGAVRPRKRAAQTGMNRPRQLALMFLALWRWLRVPARPAWPTISGPRPAPAKSGYTTLPKVAKGLGLRSGRRWRQHGAAHPLRCGASSLSQALSVDPGATRC